MFFDDHDEENEASYVLRPLSPEGREREGT